MNNKQQKELQHRVSLIQRRRTTGTVVTTVIFSFRHTNESFCTEQLWLTLVKVQRY